MINSVIFDQFLLLCILKNFNVCGVCCIANDQPLLEPLLFPSSLSENSSGELQSLPVECLLCDKLFTKDEKSDVIIDHLLTSHNLVIGELQEIADLPK